MIPLVSRSTSKPAPGAEHKGLDLASQLAEAAPPETPKSPPVAVASALPKPLQGKGNFSGKFVHFRALKENLDDLVTQGSDLASFEKFFEEVAAHQRLCAYCDLLNHLSLKLSEAGELNASLRVTLQPLKTKMLGYIKHQLESATLSAFLDVLNKINKEEFFDIRKALFQSKVFFNLLKIKRQKGGKTPDFTKEQVGALYEGIQIFIQHKPISDREDTAETLIWAALAYFIGRETEKQNKQIFLSSIIQKIATATQFQMNSQTLRDFITDFLEDAPTISLLLNEPQFSDAKASILEKTWLEILDKTKGSVRYSIKDHVKTIPLSFGSKIRFFWIQAKDFISRFWAAFTGLFKR